MKKVAILYICTGRYHIFWKEFYETFKKNFLKNSHVEYFVYTDAKELPYETNNDVHKIFQKSLGWPQMALQRFAVFLREAERWKDFDYTFFINANFLCVKEVKEEDFLPIQEDLLVAEHASAHGKDPREFTYDRNPNCTAYIPMGEGQYYVMGGLNGGKTEAYMRMVRELKENVDKDTANKANALWLDESHLNHYIIGRTDVKVLPPCYGYPEGWDLPYEAVFFIRDKSKYFDVQAFKTETLWGRIKLYLGRIKSKVSIRKRLAGIKSLFKKGEK